MSHESIVEYYNKSFNAYRDGWGLDDNMQLNLGFWHKGTRSLSEALTNLNAYVAEQAQLSPDDLVLDAGCGVGGTIIHLVKHHGCRGHGITLVPHQVRKATENAGKNGVAHHTSFQVMDFCQTTFPDNHFDVITGIESICHADSKRAFLQEAYRILKPGGRMILVETLQAKPNLTPREHDQLYTRGFHGCKITSIDTADQYLTNLKELGFSHFEAEDKTALVWPSVRRLRRMYYLAWLYNQYKALTGKPFGDTEKAHTRMCYYLYTGLKNKLWSYGVIKAVK